MPNRQDPKEYQQHLPTLKVKGCARHITTCQIGKPCLLPSKKGGLKHRTSDRTLYVIYNCQGDKPCIFNAREMANSMLAEKCHVPKPARSCHKPPQPKRKG